MQCWADYSIQILNLTDPLDPRSVSEVVNSIDLQLGFPNGVAIFENGSRTYGAVTLEGDDGVQILNLTDPANPRALGVIFDNDTYTLDKPYAGCHLPKQLPHVRCRHRREEERRPDTRPDRPVKPEGGGQHQ